jgi:hypothetical protein
MPVNSAAALPSAGIFFRVWVFSLGLLAVLVMAAASVAGLSALKVLGVRIFGAGH